jgi:SprB repeat
VDYSTFTCEKPILLPIKSVSMRNIYHLSFAHKPFPNSHFNLILPFFVLLLSNALWAQHRPVFLGHTGKNDQCNKLIRTTDGSYLLAGIVNNNAALYKFDCGGQVLDSLQFDFPADDSFEEFFDVTEMADGGFMAVGRSTFSQLGTRAFVVRVNANLELIKADTVKILNRVGGEIRSIIRTKSGNLYVTGLRANIGSFDFSDGFVATLNASTLQTQDSIAQFSYGIDVPRSLMQSADGNLVLTGVSVTGNIFNAENVLNNIAWIRKIDLKGQKMWDYKHEGAFKSKFGTMFFANAVENPATGNLFAVGNIFTGDTTKNDILDPHYVLINSKGQLLDKLSIPMKGSQNIYQTVNFPSQGNPFLIVGDSTSNVFAGIAAPLLAAAIEANDKIFPILTSTNQDVPIVSIKSVVIVPTERFAYAGLFYDPTEPAGKNWDLFLGLPTFEIKTEITNYTAKIIEPVGPGFEYFWLKDNTLASQEQSVAPAQSTEYVLIVRDPQGCINAIPVNIIIPPLKATAKMTPVSCFGGKDGKVELNALGGIPPYIYNIGTDSIIKNLSAGTYTFEVIDSRNNVFDIKVTVTQPSLLSIKTSVAQNNISANATGGTSPFQYSIDGQNYQNSKDFTNLPNKTYTVIVRDANGCTATTQVVINFVGTDELLTEWGVRISPNPTASWLLIEASQLPSGNWEARINDESGRVLQVLQWKTGQNTLQERIDLSLFPAGKYFLFLSNGEKAATLPIQRL